MSFVASIPLAMRLRKRIHRVVALAQDLMVMEAYDSPGAVIHGGTAIWRCYRRNWFSEEVDFYVTSVAEAALEGPVRHLLSCADREGEGEG